MFRTEIVFAGGCIREGPNWYLQAWYTRWISVLEKLLGSLMVINMAILLMQKSIDLPRYPGFGNFIAPNLWYCTIPRNLNASAISKTHAVANSTPLPCVAPLSTADWQSVKRVGSNKRPSNRNWICVYTHLCVAQLTYHMQPEQNGRYFAEYIFKYILLKDVVYIFIQNGDMKIEHVSIFKHTLYH